MFYGKAATKKSQPFPKSKKGKVTAKKAGECTITATVGPGASAKKLSCNIKVKSRLSCKANFIRCYSDEYEMVQINAKKLSKYETLIITDAESEAISADWDQESDYYDIVFIPKKLGIAKMTVKIRYEEGRYFDIKNDSLTFFVVSYPDRTGWISSSDLSNYDIEFFPRGNDTYMLSFYYGQKNTTVSTLISYDMNPNTDTKTNGIYSTADGLMYKIEDGGLYFNTENLENMFFNSLF